MGGGEVHMDLRVSGQPGFHLGVLVRGVVVHHQVQLDVGVGAGDLLEEGQELLVPVARLERRGHLPGGHLKSGEQGRRAVPDVVVDRRSIRCGWVGSTGAVRSRAWIWDFSSTDSTIVFSGGSRYRPTTLASNCGSVGNRNDSARQGWIPYPRQMTATE